MHARSRAGPQVEVWRAESLRMNRLDFGDSAFSVSTLAALAVTPGPAAGSNGLLLSELIGALSHALDLTEGQPKGHSVRCGWIGMHIGRELGLPPREQWELY